VLVQFSKDEEAAKSLELPDDLFAAKNEKARLRLDAAGACPAGSGARGACRAIAALACNAHGCSAQELCHGSREAGCPVAPATAQLGADGRAWAAVRRAEAGGARSAAASCSASSTARRSRCSRARCAAWLPPS